MLGGESPRQDRKIVPTGPYSGPADGAGPVPQDSHASPFLPPCPSSQEPVPTAATLPVRTTSSRQGPAGLGVRTQCGLGPLWEGWPPGARRRCICHRRPSRCRLRPRESGTHHRQRPHHTRCPAPLVFQWPAPCSGGTVSPAPPAHAPGSARPAPASL